MQDEPSYIAAARAFISFVRSAVPGQAGRVEALAGLLAQLAFAQHQTSDIQPSDSEAEPPPRDPALESAVSMAFGDIGLYLLVTPVAAAKIETTPVLVGDAVDDLADITADLTDVVWLFENVSEADARWQFHFGFRSHWGRHLYELAGRLHYLLYESGDPAWTSASL